MRIILVALNNNHSPSTCCQQVQLLVIGCCVALAVSKPAEDACRIMKARLFPSLEESARDDADGLRACDADRNDAVDAAELVSCIQRAFSDTAGLKQAAIGERINCFRNIMTGTTEGGEQLQTVDREVVRQHDFRSLVLAGGVNGGSAILGLNYEDQEQLSEILTWIAAGQLQVAYDALINWYIHQIIQSTGVLNGVLQHLSFTLQSVLSGRSFETLVYMVTAFVRSSNNALTSPVEDALISSLFEISFGFSAAAENRIQARLDAGVLNPAIQNELQSIVDTLADGLSDQAVKQIISLLTGITATLNSDTLVSTEFNFWPALYDLLDLYFGRNSTKEIIIASESFMSQVQETEQFLNNEQVQMFETLEKSFEEKDLPLSFVTLLNLVMSSCGFDGQFVALIYDILTSGFYNIPELESEMEIISTNHGEESVYVEALILLKTAVNELKNNEVMAATDEIQKIFQMCVEKVKD
ncbi:EF-Hand 1 calcium-binding site [Trinorchestia longiramus]|nr:EF-Hand 1 calcium-binding site [Trinorchestia longiramus]